MCQTTVSKKTAPALASDAAQCEKSWVRATRSEYWTRCTRICAPMVRISSAWTPTRCERDLTRESHFVPQERRQVQCGFARYGCRNMWFPCTWMAKRQNLSSYDSAMPPRMVSRRTIGLQLNSAEVQSGTTSLAVPGPSKVVRQASRSSTRWASCCGETFMHSAIGSMQRWTSCTVPWVR